MEALPSSWFDCANNCRVPLEGIIILPAFRANSKAIFWPWSHMDSMIHSTQLQSDLRTQHNCSWIGSFHASISLLQYAYLECPNPRTLLPKTDDGGPDYSCDYEATTARQIRMPKWGSRPRPRTSNKGLVSVHAMHDDHHHRHHHHYHYYFFVFGLTFLGCEMFESEISQLIRTCTRIRSIDETDPRRIFPWIQY